jgi:hypothetical protein
MATEPIGFLPVPKTMKELELVIQPPTLFTNRSANNNLHPISGTRPHGCRDAYAVDATR